MDPGLVLCPREGEMWTCYSRSTWDDRICTSAMWICNSDPHIQLNSPMQALWLVPVHSFPCSFPRSDKVTLVLAVDHRTEHEPSEQPTSSCAGVMHGWMVLAYDYVGHGHGGRDKAARDITDTISHSQVM